MFSGVNATVPSAARVLDLLEYLAGQSDGASLSEAVAALRLPKSSTLMLLRTLVARGYALRDAADRYRLHEAFRTHGFGWGGHGHARLVALAEPLMARLRDVVGETVLLGVAETRGVRLLAKAVALADLRYDVELSRVSPFYCTAMGRVLTAFAPEAARNAMLDAVPRVAMTPATVTELPALHAIVARVRREALAIVEEEWVLGGTGIAVPVLGADGAILATLDVGCVTTRFHAKRDHIIASVREAGQALGALLRAP
jgi:DNA-binding IclR family transcriptional regulator